MGRSTTAQSVATGAGGVDSRRSSLLLQTPAPPISLARATSCAKAAKSFSPVKSAGKVMSPPHHPSSSSSASHCIYPSPSSSSSSSSRPVPPFSSSASSSGPSTSGSSHPCITAVTAGSASRHLHPPPLPLSFLPIRPKVRAGGSAGGNESSAETAAGGTQREPNVEQGGEVQQSSQQQQQDGAEPGGGAGGSDERAEGGGQHAGGKRQQQQQEADTETATGGADPPAPVSILRDDAIQEADEEELSHVRQQRSICLHAARLTSCKKWQCRQWDWASSLSLCLFVPLLFPSSDYHWCEDRPTWHCDGYES